MGAKSCRTVGNQTITLISLFSAIIACYGLSHIAMLELPPSLEGGGHWQFLTNLGLILSLIIFILGAVAHLTKSTFLFNLKNTIHPIGLAVELIITLVYWPLRLFLIDLLLPDPNRDLLPLLVDLSIHLMPVVSLLVDYLVFMPKWTITNSTAILIVVFLTSGYYYLLQSLIDVNNGGVYPYGFLNTETELQRIIIFIVIGSIAFIQIPLMRLLYDKIVTGTSELETKIDKKD